MSGLCCLWETLGPPELIAAGIQHHRVNDVAKLSVLDVAGLIGVAAASQFVNRTSARQLIVRRRTTFTKRTSGSPEKREPDVLEAWRIANS